jgi:hypothetical protein
VKKKMNALTTAARIVKVPSMRADMQIVSTKENNDEFIAR